MNLQRHLMLRITLVGLLCLLAITAYVLVDGELRARAASQQLTESLAKQLELQLWRSDAGFRQGNAFPDFGLWKETSSAPGVCVRFVGVDNTAHSVCQGVSQAHLDTPDSFQAVYRWLLTPGLSQMRTLSFKGRVYGSLLVTPSADMEMALAWDTLCHLLGLSLVTVLAVCLLVYFSISRALRPASLIVAGLERLQQGHLAERLPNFELIEWQRTATAINQLAASQQQLLAERQQLSLQLLHLQEEERRYVARELHDEFGQCLAAINAVAASIAQTAAQQCPVLVDEAAHISRITQHLLDDVRGLLKRLRPAGLDELGLAAGLEQLVSGWAAQNAGKTRYQLRVVGDCALLSDVLAVTLLRITQECLTNIAKHSAAQQATVGLEIQPDAVVLTVADNGNAVCLPLVAGIGMGLVGIKERVAALDGRLCLSLAQPHGLIVEVWLPIIH